MTIKEKIIKEVENKIINTGAIGTKIVNVKLTISEEEKEELFNADLGKNYSYDLEGNILYISYTEKLKMDKEKIIKTINEMFNIIELQVKYNEKYNVFTFTDLQGANLGDIESETHKSIISCINRIDNYIDDYFYSDLQDQLDYDFNLKFTGGDYKDLCKFVEKNNLVYNYQFDYDVLNLVANLYDYSDILSDNKEVAKLLELKNSDNKEIEILIKYNDEN